MIRHRFTVLLVVLLVLLLSLPLLTEFKPARAVFITLFYGTLVSAVAAVAERRKHFVVLGSLAVIAVTLRAVSLSHPGWLTFRLIGVVVEMLCFGYIALLILRFVLGTDRVTFDMISAALCAYLLIGIVWAQMYIALTATALAAGDQGSRVFSPSLLGTIEEEDNDVDTARQRERMPMVDPPGGIKAAPLDAPTMERQPTRPDESEISQHLDKMFITAIYVSFVTLSTLGYGDIQPVNDLARMCAVVEAIIGQFYLAVLVARLVGLHIAGTNASAD